MAKNYIQAGDHITVPAVADVVSGSPVSIGALFGIAEHSANEGEPLTIARVGVFILPKAAGEVWAVGDAVYYDAANNVVTSADGTGPVIGVAVETVLGPAADGPVLLGGAVSSNATEPAG